MPEVGFEQSSYSVAEGSENPLLVTVVSNASVPDGVVQVDINSLTAKGQNFMYILDLACKLNVLHAYVCTQHFARISFATIVHVFYPISEYCSCHNNNN